MATNWILICILVTVASQGHARTIIHPIFKYLNLTTRPPTTSDGLNVGDRLPKPDVTFPSREAIFLNFLIHRKNYFQSNGWEGKSNSGVGSHKSTALAFMQTTEGYSNSSSLGAGDTTTTPHQDTRTTTNASTTSRTGQIVNEERTTSRDLTTTLPETNQNLGKDRDHEFSQTDLWFNKVMRPPVIQQSWARPTSSEHETHSPPSTIQPHNQPSNVEVISKATTSGPSSSSRTNDGADTDSKASAYTVKESTTDSPTSTVTEGNWEGPTHVEVQDKPFYGTSLEWYFSHNNTNWGGHEASTEEPQTNGDDGNPRQRRAASPDVANGNGSSCYDTVHFEQCMYYPTCFPEIERECKSRVSFIGDDVYRFCAKIIDIAPTIKSVQLISYLKKVDECVREELITFLESPSCDDVTLCLTRALLVNSRSSCLYQGGLICNITEDPEARPQLAKILNSQTADVDFMSRLMVNIGDMTSYCRSQGSSIFVTDIAMLATAKDGPFKEKYGNTPIPGVVEKI